MTDARRPNPEHGERRELIDALFDRELDRPAREELLGQLRLDPTNAAEVARMQRMIALMRRPPSAPDLTDTIMTRVDHRRRFLPPAMRRFVTAGRLAAAASIAVAVLGFAVTERFAPGALTFRTEPRPLSAVVASGKTDASAGVQNVTQAFETLKQQACEPVDAICRAAGGETRVVTIVSSQAGTRTIGYLDTSLSPGSIRTPGLVGPEGHVTLAATGAGDWGGAAFIFGDSQTAAIRYVPSIRAGVVTFPRFERGLMPPVLSAPILTDQPGDQDPLP